MAQQIQQPRSVASGKQAAAQQAGSAGRGKSRRTQGITEEQRHNMIAEAAYLIAEQRDFQGDMALNDWLQAEAEVRALFAARH